MSNTKHVYLAGLAALSLVAACNDADTSSSTNTAQQDSHAVSGAKAPGEVFDLSPWNILLPLDRDGDGKADKIKNKDLASFHVDEFFYLDDNNNMVFAAANKAFTSPTSTNTRSELRQVYADENGNVPSLESPANYFALASNPDSDKFAAIGARMEATLKVDHVSTNAKYHDKPPHIRLL